MKIRLETTLLTVLLAASFTSGCDSCGSGTGSRSGGPAPLAPSESLIGDDAKAGTDSSVIESGEDAYLAIGYFTGGAKSRPVIAFFKWSGGKYTKETDVALEGSGVPVFSPEKASNLAGIRNLNNIGAPELLARTTGDCGEGSSYLTIISRDGKDIWTRVFSGCEGTQKEAKTTVETEMATSGNEVIKFKTYELENSEFVLRKSEALVWDKEAWHVYKTRNLMVPSSPIIMKPLKK